MNNSNHSKPIKKLDKQLVKVEKSVVKKADKVKKRADNKGSLKSEIINHAASKNNSVGPHTANAVSKMRKAYKPSVVETRVHKWLLGLMNPSIPNAPGCPYGRAPGTKLQRYQFFEEFYVQANNVGFCCLMIHLDSWTFDYQVGNPLVGTAKILATTPGYPVWWTGGTFAGETIPTAGSSTTTGFTRWQLGAASSLGTLIPGMQPTSTYRLLSAGIYASPDMQIVNNSGALCMCQSTNYVYSSGLNPISTSAMAGNTYASLVGAPSSVMTTREYELSNWKEGCEAVLVGIPTSEVYYQPQIVNSSGQNNSPSGFMGFVCSGMQPNAVIRTRVYFNYEVIAIPSYLASTMAGDENVPNTMGSASLSQIPSSDIVRHHATQAMIRPVGSADAAGPAAAVLHSNLLNTNSEVTKPQATSFGQNLINSVETGVKMATKIAPYIESLGELLAL